MSVRILIGDALTRLRDLPNESVHCCVTSPPYWGLRDYGVEGQIGLEPSQEAYVARIVAVFAEVRRVLRPDGTCWVNLGDSYNAAGRVGHGTRIGYKQGTSRASACGEDSPRPSAVGLKPKDLVGIPWRVAFALQADGWWLRSDIIWHKPNPMPESVTDRPTKAHEYVFLLTKSERYFYDAEAIAEPIVYGDHPRNGTPGPPVQSPGQPAQAGITKRRRLGNKGRVIAVGVVGGRPADHLGSGIPWEDRNGTRNARSVWTIATQPFPGSHFATMPPALAERCIKAGCPADGTVLDPFGGAGTTGLVADRLQRDAVLIELSPVYAQMAERRIRDASPLLSEVEVIAA